MPLFGHELREKLRHALESNPRAAAFGARVRLLHDQGLSNEQIAEDEEVKGCFIAGGLALLIGVGTVLGAVNAVIQFAEWLKTKMGSAAPARDPFNNDPDNPSTNL